MNTKSPLVSVCVITYQHVNYIKQCLDSILMQQTSFPFEIILGEDESNDGTRETCKDYANKYPDKIKLFLRSRKDVIYINGKPTGRFNFIENLKVAKGKYIALCEGDDYWTDPLKLQKQVQLLEKYDNCTFCSHRAYMVKSNGEIDGTNIIIPFKEIHGCLNTAQFFNLNAVATSSMIFRNKSIEALNVLKHSHGDFLMYCELLHYGQAGFINDVMSVYRKHSGGLTQNIISQKYMYNRIKEMQLEYLYFTNKSVKWAVKKRVVKKIMRFLDFYKQSITREVRKELMSELLISPFFYKQKGKELFLKVLNRINNKSF